MRVKWPIFVFIRQLGLTAQNHYPVTMAICAKSSLTSSIWTYLIFFSIT